MSKSIDVDTKTFIRFWLVLLGFAVLALFIWKALTGLIIVGISIFLAIAIKPLGDKLASILSRRKKKHGTFFSVLAYIIVLVVILGIIAAVGPMVVTETSKFIGDLPQNFENTIGGWEGINDFGKNLGIPDLHGQLLSSLESFSRSITDNLGSIVMNSIGAIGSIFSSVAFILVLTLFFMIEGPSLMNQFWAMLHGRRESVSVNVARRIINRMGAVISTYVSRQVIVALIDGCVVALTVFILSLIFRFAGELSIPLGLIAMIFYLIPMFGQIIGCILVTALLLFNAPWAALIFAIFYLIYAQVENNVIAPHLQGSSLGLPPVIILVAIIIGTYMFGLLGAIIAVPIAGCIKVLIEEYPNIRDLREKA